MDVVDSTQRYQLILQLWNIVDYLQAFVKGSHHDVGMLFHSLMIICQCVTSKGEQILQIR